MKKLFYEVDSFDRKCYEKYALNEDILQENASGKIERFIRKKFAKNSSILIVCGSGNNGADGLALARKLYKDYEIFVYLASEPKSSMAKLQYKRLEALGYDFSKNRLTKCDVVVDCLFGSGLNKALDKKYSDLIAKINLFDGYKIACDIPSGLSKDGVVLAECFKADTTITMGALKLGLFSDGAKDFVGSIKVANLGISQTLYEENTNFYLLEKSDMKLPYREKKCTNKGDFGHLAVFIGEKTGAGLLCCKAAFSFGVGLVSAVCEAKSKLPLHIMSSKKLPQKCSAVAFGMGLGKVKKEDIESLIALNIPKVVDADIFYDKLVLKLLKQNCVLTPHPKEFVSLLALCGFEKISVEKLQQNRFKYAQEFCLKFPNVVLYLKGANSIIAQKDTLYINNFGTSKLSKGGSGDVLAGLIASLLAQGYKSLEATITASLVHTFCAKKCKKNSYALKPQDIIKEAEVFKRVKGK